MNTHALISDILTAGFVTKVQSLKIDKIPESRFQARLDLALGLCFLTISLFAGYRAVKSWTVPSGGRKVISVFNTLLFLASAFRAIWFLIPNDCLEPSYEPLPKKFQEYKNESGLLASEILLSMGSFFLYGIFILIACYWYTMMGKLEADKSSSSINLSEHGMPSSLSTTDPTAMLSPASRQSGRAVGTLELFFPILGVMFTANIVNILFFIWGWFDTEIMVTIDAISFAIFATIVLGVVIYLSHKINRVLRNMEVINQSSSQAQIRRIEAIVFLAKFFFATRIMIELGMSWWMLNFPHVFGGQGKINDQFWWNSYVISKHAVEVLVLTMELFISSAIRSYDNRRVTQRYTPLSTGPGGPSLLGSGLIYNSGSGVGIELHDQIPGSSRRISYGAVNDGDSFPKGGSITRPVYAQQPSIQQPLPQFSSGRSSFGGGEINMGMKSINNYQSIPSVPIEGRMEAGTIRYVSNSGSNSMGLSSSVTRGKAYSGVLSVSLTNGSNIPNGTSPAASTAITVNNTDDRPDYQDSESSSRIYRQKNNSNSSLSNYGEKKSRVQDV